MLDGLHSHNLTATAFLGLMEDDRPQQFTVVSSNTNVTTEFGIDEYLSLNSSNVRAVEMSALGYHFQSLSLAATCVSYSIVNTLHLNSFTQKRGCAYSADNLLADSDYYTSARVVHPAILALIVIGAPGLFAAIQTIGAAVTALTVRAVKNLQAR